MTEQPRPVPVVTALTEPYWAAVRQRSLVAQWCTRCRTFSHFPMDRCPSCGDGAALDWRPIRGTGVIYTYTVIHRSTVPGFVGAAPFAVAWVDMDVAAADGSGPRMFGTVVGCPVQDVHIGMPVRVRFDELPGFGPLPVFAAVGDDPDGGGPQE